MAFRQTVSGLSEGAIFIGTQHRACEIKSYMSHSNNILLDIPLHQHFPPVVLVARFPVEMPLPPRPHTQQHHHTASVRWAPGDSFWKW